MKNYFDKSKLPAEKYIICVANYWTEAKGLKKVVELSKVLDDEWVNWTWEEIQEYYFYPSDIDRTDLDLIDVVKKLGNKANGTFSELKIVEIPDGIEWEISEYDGLETVEEKHRSWI